MRRRAFHRQTLHLEQLEQRVVLDGTGCIASDWHNSAQPLDVNADLVVSPVDALLVINTMATVEMQMPLAQMSSPPDDYVDVTNDGMLSPHDALSVVNGMYSSVKSGSDFTATFKDGTLDSDNLITESDVRTILDRASMASASDDAIIAVVDRTGIILGVRVEDGVSDALTSDADKIAFAIDGAVAKARTAAFFSSGAAPLTSRTIRFISQSTVTQREVESSPLNADGAYRGPGFVAPIGVGGHFPPEVAFTPQVDLFAIEHQSRDSQVHPGFDGIKGTADDFELTTRFNVDPSFVAAGVDGAPGAEDFFDVWPEAYGVASDTSPNAQSRGIATLPGGVPLFKTFVDASGDMGVNLVGGIGVFFPGPDGFATHEQGFEHAATRAAMGRPPQTEFERNNAERVLESEFIAVAAAAGGGTVGPTALIRDLSEFTDPGLPRYRLLIGRIDLVGITLEVYGPTPSRQHPIPGIDRLIEVGRGLTPSSTGGFEDYPVNKAGDLYLPGQAVPEEWLVVPHDAEDGSLTAEQVELMIHQGIEEANRTRAAIRLDENFRPGPRTRMVLAVADKSGNLLGLFRMPDATVFSIDVAVAKARNTAYYADPDDLVDADRIDFNGDGVFGSVTTSFDGDGDTVPRGTALTNRTFRFLVEPRYPTGSELRPTDDDGLMNDGRNLCEQRPETCTKVGSQSILRLPGINPLTAENLVDTTPLDVSFYNGDSGSFLAFDAFNVSRNFHDPGDADVVIAGTDMAAPLANQNGVVFFPGSAALYVRGKLVGGFGVSGDGVDQDDVVTSAGFFGFEAPAELRVDHFIVGHVRLPYVKFNRNPLGE